MEIILDSILITLTLMIVTFLILKIGVISRLVERHSLTLKQFDTVFGAVAVTTLVLTVIIYNLQTEAQRETETQNEYAYLLASQQDIAIDTSTVSYILGHLTEFRKNNEAILGQYEYGNIEKLADDTNLNEDTRKNIIISIANMNHANSLIQDILNPLLGRQQLLDQLESSTDILQSELNWLNIELNPTQSNSASSTSTDSSK